MKSVHTNVHTLLWRCGTKKQAALVEAAHAHIFKSSILAKETNLITAKSLKKLFKALNVLLIIRDVVLNPDKVSLLRSNKCRCIQSDRTFL